MPEASVYRGPLRLAAGTCGGGCKTRARGSESEAAHSLFCSDCGSAHSAARSQLSEDTARDSWHREMRADAPAPVMQQTEGLGLGQEAGPCLAWGTLQAALAASLVGLSLARHRVVSAA